MAVVFDPILGMFKTDVCSGSGVMTKAEYDSDDDGVVNSADKVLSPDESKYLTVGNDGLIDTGDMP